MKPIPVLLPGVKVAGTHSPHELFSMPSDSDDITNPMNLRSLGHRSVESWLAHGAIEPVRLSPNFKGLRSQDYLFICAAIPLKLAQIEAQSQALYDELLDQISKHPCNRFVRIWNYISHINAGFEPEDEDQECYRRFCSGRAAAFDKHPSFATRSLPAATAIGAHDNMLRISAICAAPDVSLRAIENSRQVSAFKYPRQYGPRAPLFSRANLVENAGQRLLLISGTASIVAHETQHPHQLKEQTLETQRNINAIVEQATKLTDIEPQHPFQPVCMRYYLRSAQDLAIAKDAFRGAFPQFPEPDFLLADICRQDLVMEIEAVYR